MNWNQAKDSNGNVYFEFENSGKLMALKHYKIEKSYNSRIAITPNFNNSGYMVFGSSVLYNLDNDFNYLDTISIRTFSSTYTYIADAFKESDSTMIVSLVYETTKMYQVGLSRISRNMEVIEDKWYDYENPFDMYPYYQSFDTTKNGFYIAANKDFALSTDIFAKYDNGIRIIKTRKDFSVVWDTTYGYDANYYIQCIKSTSDGGCLLVGTRYDYNQPEERLDMYILKLDSLGNKTTSAIIGSGLTENQIQLYPNPGQNQININFEQPTVGLFKLFNLNGAEVYRQTFNGTSASFNLPNLNAGMYLYEVTGGNGIMERGKWVRN